jgi:lysozyme family protein
MRTIEGLRADYRGLWDKAEVTKTTEAMRQARLINSHRSTYEDVGKAVGEAWWVIAVLHLREAGEGDFGRWLCVLHNGEKIIGTGRKTSLMPKDCGPFTSLRQPKSMLSTVELTKSPSRMERMPHRISGLRIRGVQRVRLSRRTQHG